MPSKKEDHLCTPAIQIAQPGMHPVYLFGLTAKDLFSIASISRISRLEDGQLDGYQRQEIKSHVDDIANYLKSAEVVFPHAIVMALPSDTTFSACNESDAPTNLNTNGHITIPKANNLQSTSAWIIDGQQRALALSKCNDITRSVPITAFVSDNVELHRDQFLRVNNTKPLPRGLVSELLPVVDTKLSKNWESSRFSAVLCDRLAQNPTSPFHGLIHRPSSSSAERKTCTVAGTSVTKMIQRSLKRERGSLFPFVNLATGDADLDRMERILIVYWSAVKQTFSDAWGLPPRQSRLSHGAGIATMGRLMDRIMPIVDESRKGAIDHVKRELSQVKAICRWTSGTWEGLEIPYHWNDILVIGKHIEEISDLLIRHYVEAKRSRS